MLYMLPEHEIIENFKWKKVLKNVSFDDVL